MEHGDPISLGNCPKTRMLGFIEHNNSLRVEQRTTFLCVPPTVVLATMHGPFHMLNTSYQSEESRCLLDKARPPKSAKTNMTVRLSPTSGHFN